MTPDTERIRRLQAAAMHDVMPESAPVHVEEWADRIILTSGGYELVVMKGLQDPIRFSGVSVRTIANLAACHALLTRAREIMAGGG